MAVYNSVSALQKKLKADIRNAVLNKIKQKCYELVRNLLMDTVYSNTNYEYERTMDLYNSVTVNTIRDGSTHVSFEVFIDSSKIDANPVEDSKWNQHMSMDGEDVSEELPVWIEEGFDSPYYQRKPAEYMLESFAEMQNGKNNIATQLAKELRSEGWKVTVL